VVNKLFVRVRPTNTHCRGCKIAQVVCTETCSFVHIDLDPCWWLGLLPQAALLSTYLSTLYRSSYLQPVSQVLRSVVKQQQQQQQQVLLGMGTASEDCCGDTQDVVRPGEAMLQTSSSSSALHMGMGLLKRSSSALVAPILVNCSGTSSDEGESSSSTDLGCDLAKRTSTASSCDAYSSQQDGGPCVTRISFEAMSKGHYKTGVRYCMETWPENAILRVGAAVAGKYKSSMGSCLSLQQQHVVYRTLIWVPSAFAAVATPPCVARQCFSC
jgi:hypothetical protein